jgi:hypothetical protein
MMMSKIRGLNWHKEVGSTGDKIQNIRKEFYKKRATVKNATKENIKGLTMEKTYVTSSKYLFGTLEDAFGSAEKAYKILQIASGKGVDGKGKFNVDRFYKGWSVSIEKKGNKGYLIKYDAKGNKKERIVLYETKEPKARPKPSPQKPQPPIKKQTPPAATKQPPKQATTKKRPTQAKVTAPETKGENPKFMAYYKKAEARMAKFDYSHFKKHETAFLDAAKKAYKGVTSWDTLEQFTLKDDEQNTAMDYAPNEKTKILLAEQALTYLATNAKLPNGEGDSDTRDIFTFNLSRLPVPASEPKPVTIERRLSYFYYIFKNNSDPTSKSCAVIDALKLKASFAQMEPMFTEAIKIEYSRLDVTIYILHGLLDLKPVPTFSQIKKYLDKIIIYRTRDDYNKLIIDLLTATKATINQSNQYIEKALTLKKEKVNQAILNYLLKTKPSFKDAKTFILKLNSSKDKKTQQLIAKLMTYYYQKQK